MEATRVEIFRNGEWLKLRLRDRGNVYYNALINRIGKIESREISHTNTFSLPYVHQNIQALGLNVFNPREMALALNSKYQARYYVNDKLLQQGYLVLNNTFDGVINVNFIDEGLDITEKWGTITYRELLESGNPDIPADYQAAIAEMTNYDLDKTIVLTPLGEVGSRGYNLALFPNNLNAIGDAFQKDENGDRQPNAFNPYQSRPIFNAKALFDLAVETYGYTPIYDPSIDWDKVALNYMVNQGLNDNLFDEGGLAEIEYPPNSVSFHYYRSSQVFNDPTDWKTTVNHSSIAAPDALRPSDIPNWVDPPSFPGPGSPGTSGNSYHDQRCVLVPRIQESTLGTIELFYSIVRAGKFWIWFLEIKICILHGKEQL